MGRRKMGKVKRLEAQMTLESHITNARGAINSRQDYAMLVRCFSKLLVNSNQVTSSQDIIAGDINSNFAVNNFRSSMF